MAKNTYLVVEGKKIKFSEIISDLPSLHPLLGDTRNKALCQIIYALCQKITEQKFFLQEGEGIEITGTGTQSNPYRVTVLSQNGIVAEGGTLLGRYSVLDGAPQNILLGENLVLDPISGVLNVVLPPPTPPDGADLHYTHIQSVAASTWVVPHNLGKYPSVSIVDSAGTPVVGDVTYTDINTVTLSFSVIFSGKAYLN